MGGGLFTQYPQETAAGKCARAAGWPRRISSAFNPWLEINLQRLCRGASVSPSLTESPLPRFMLNESRSFIIAERLHVAAEVEHRLGEIVIIVLFQWMFCLTNPTKGSLQRGVTPPSVCLNKVFIFGPRDARYATVCDISAKKLPTKNLSCHDINDKLLLLT